MFRLGRKLFSLSGLGPGSKFSSRERAVVPPSVEVTGHDALIEIQSRLQRALAERDELRTAANKMIAKNEELQEYAGRLKVECDSLAMQLAAADNFDKHDDSLQSLNYFRDCVFAPRLLGPPLEKMNILLLGTCQVMPLVEAAQTIGYQTDHFLFGSNLHAPIPQISPEKYDAVVVGLTLRHILNDTCGASPDTAHMKGWNAPLILDACQKLIRDRIQSLHDFYQSIPVFFLSFPEPSYSYLGNLVGRNDPNSFATTVRSLNDRLSAILMAFPNCYFIDMNELLNLVGRAHLQDDILTHATHASFIGDWDLEYDQNRLLPPISKLATYNTASQLKKFGHVLLNLVADNLKIIRQTGMVKLIIVDLDDTLWRGVAAEDSAEAWAYVEGWPLGFIEALLYFKHRGGLLAISSKNDHDKTLKRMREIWGERISIDDFSTVKINWDPKSKNIEEILKETNILPSNALFIDDNPREIDEVRSRFPELRCLGGNHYDWRRIILRSPETQVAFISAESNQRTELVRARIQREVRAQTMSRVDWLTSLYIKQSFSIVRSSQHPRFARMFELVNKTNQFNTTGKRWSTGDFMELFGAGGYCILAFLRDKAVDNGMIGVTIMKGSEILQAVLSCRVFGLGAETGMARVATTIAMAHGRRAIARIVDTGKNFACHEYFHNHGFSKVDEHYESVEPCAFPDWIHASFVGEDNEECLNEATWIAWALESIRG